MRIHRYLLILIVLASGSAWAAEPKLTAKGVEFFEAKIRPVLLQRCYSCHSSSAKEVKGGLLLDTREGLRKGGESGASVVPGDVEESLLIQAIKHETYEMPPGDKLGDDVIADFEKWIEMGAPDPRGRSDAKKRISLSDARKFWSLQPVKRVSVPQPRSASWPRSDIDRFILSKLEERQLTPVADASRPTLLRRLSFDLIGLPPTLQEIDAFMHDASGDAVERVVDRLLDSPQFGERWGRHWLDAARYGESTGKERNIAYPHAWRYRDWVIDSLNNDKPYNRFLIEQVAGDLLPAKSTAEQNQNLIATGLLALGTKSLNERKREQYLADVADEQIDVVTRAVLGMTVACARCHDHKFDPITQADYFALAGVFRSTELLAGVKPGNNKQGYAGELAYLMPESGRKPPKHTPEEKARLEELEQQIPKLQSELQTALVRVRSGKAKSPAKLKAAAQRTRKRLNEAIAERKSLESKTPTSDQPVMAVRDASDPGSTQLHIRGDVDQRGDLVPRGIPVVLAIGRSPRIESSQSGRMQLAHWLASKENPLTARVMANRTWAHLLGRGIVESLDNFGALGDEPTHPELLDYLAHRFMENGWSVKKLIREIVLSRTYQLSSEHQEQNYAVDADNRYLWRSNVRRLEAEAIRDAILAASGRLDLTRPEGSPVMNLSTGEIGRGKNVRLLAETTHRSVYLPQIRGAVPETLAVFDAADPSLPVGQREVTTVATQALFLMNSPFVIENCQALAQRLQSEGSGDDRGRVDRLFQLVLGRPAMESERQQALDYVARYEALLADKVSSSTERRMAAWSSLAQTVFATGEFRYLY